MKRRLKAAIAFARPYRTHYFESAHSKTPDFTSQGSSASEQGAIRAAVVRLFMGQYQKAVIYDRFTGVPVYNIRRQPGGGFKIGFGSGISFHEWENGR